MRIVTTHKNTDFDALASVIAATIIYPDAIPVLPAIVNPNVKAFLSLHKDIFNLYAPNEIDLDKVKTLIVVDANNWSRLDQKIQPLRQRDDLEILIWDHHMKNMDISSSWMCREEMGANITLMIRRLKAENKSLTPMQATLFLTGLYEDTGNLTFSSSKAEDASAAAYLLRNRADLKILGSLLRPVYGERQKQILFEMLKTEKRTKLNGYRVSFNAVSITGHVGNLSLVVQMYKEILNVDAAFGIFDITDKDKCCIIGRSDTDGINIGAIMRQLGGGGHPGAGSAMLRHVMVEDIQKRIIHIIEKGQKPSLLISDLMTCPVFSVTSDTPMETVAFMLREKGCTGVPVINDGRIVGIISRRDFRKVRKDSQLKAPVRAYMSTNVIKIEADKSPMQAVNLMVRHDIGRLPVISDGKLAGIITRSDAMVFFYDMLPD